MTDDSKAPDLGPLPASDRNAELQRHSVKAVHGLLRNTDEILFRDERIEDYGVDGSFELKVGGAFTNLRCQVQLKGSDVVKPNADASISHQVDTYNLNYLLNGHS